MKLITCVVLAVITAAVPASAQSTQSAGSTDFSGVRPKGLPTVYVMDRQGQEIKGKIMSWSDSAIVLRIADGATRTFKPGEAVRIDLRGDSLKNGALIGAGVGLGLGLLSGGFADCPGSGESCAGTRVGLTVLGTALYAAIGHRDRCANPRTHTTLECRLSGDGRRIDVQYLGAEAQRVCRLEIPLMTGGNGVSDVLIGRRFSRPGRSVATALRSPECCTRRGIDRVRAFGDSVPGTRSSHETAEARGDPGSTNAGSSPC